MQKRIVTKTNNLHTYRNEINTVNQLKLNYFTNIHLLMPQFINILCVITIKLNTLTDVPYQKTVGGAFVYVCENLLKRSRRVNDVDQFEQRSNI